MHSMKVPHGHLFIDHVEPIGHKLVPAENVDPVDACGLKHVELYLIGLTEVSGTQWVWLSEL